MKRLLLMTALVVFALGAALPAPAQDTQGPMAPPPKFVVKRISAEPHPGPPPIPAEDIIRRFAANEVVMQKQYDAYNYSQMIRLEELTDPGGKFTVTGEVYTRPDGQRYLRITKEPESTLKVMAFSLEDVKTIATLPLFVLTPDEIANYSFLYAGQDKLDQINTYVFQVKPQQLSRTHRLFDGVIWVDDQDFVIVKSFGKFVSELSDNGTKLPFTMFETFRENFQDKYWLPTYTRSDDYSQGADNTEQHLRLVIRDTDFKLISSPAAVAPASQPSSSTSLKPVTPPNTPPSPH
ncbi:MAG: hypothetical protein ACRD5M_05270 [Candidatus Acidiferrales bacterium]